MSSEIRNQIFDRISYERENQDLKWGDRSISENRLPYTMWITILSEEVGEAAKEVLEKNKENLKKEILQVAAVAVAILEVLENDS